MPTKSEAHPGERDKRPTGLRPGTLGRAVMMDGRPRVVLPQLVFLF